MRWLHNASDHGIGRASHNLASAYLAGGGDLPPAERRAKVKQLLAKARDQGFAFFAGEPGDERYLQTLEAYAASNGIGMPWQTGPCQGTGCCRPKLRKRGVAMTMTDRRPYLETQPGILDL